MPHHRLATTLCAVALSTLSSLAGARQTSLDWTATIPPVGSTTVFDVATDAQGNLFVLTSVNSSQMALTRVDSAGSTAWVQTFLGPQGFTQAEAVALSWDETAVYALGRSSLAATSSDYAIVKYDAATGATVWTQFVDGGDQGIDSPSDLAGTPDGGVVATGGFDTPSEQRDFGTVRLDADGNVLWTRLYTGFGQFLFENDDAEHVIVDAGGDVVISGNAMSGSDSDIVTIRYDGVTGTTLWEARWEGSENDVTRGLAFAPDGDVIMLGIDDFTGGRRWVLARYDLLTGAEEWSLLLNLGQDETARHLAVGADGTVYATGSADPDFIGSNGNDTLEAVAVNGETGELLWSIDFGDTGTGDGDFGARIYPDDRGSVWIVGGTSSLSLVNDPLEDDGLVLELSAATGGVRSVTLLDTSTPTSTHRDALRHAGTDALGRLYVVGAIRGDSNATLAARFQLDSNYADLGGSLAGAGGAPSLDGSGLVVPGRPVTLFLSGALPSSVAALVVGFGQLGSPLLGGTLVPSPDLVLQGLTTDATGSITSTATWPALPPGTELVFQHWIFDPSGPSGFTASNGLSLTQR